MKIIYFLIFILLISSCQKAYFKSVSRELDKIYGSGTISNGLTFNEIRLLAYKKSKDVLDRIFKEDTVFILEFLSLEDRQTYNTFWNRSGQISFRQDQKKIVVIDTAFDQTTMQLIENWDSTGIRLQEKLYSDIIPIIYYHGNRVSGTYKSFKIDTIIFKRFINLDR